MQPDEPIAIVGIGGLFPGLGLLDQFWANVRDGIDSTSDVPPGRWLIDPTERSIRGSPWPTTSTRPAAAFSTAAARSDRGSTSTRSLLERLDPVFQLALLVAQQAWSDARTDRVDRGRVGVVFGNIVLPTETASAI